MERGARFKSPSGFFWPIFRWVIFSGLTLLVVGLFIGLVRLGWDYSHRNWRGKEPFRVLLVEQKGDVFVRGVVFSYFPDFKRVLVLQLPPDLKVRALGGLGEYQFQSYYRLQQQEQLPEAFFRESLSHALGSQIHQTVFMTLGSEKERLLSQLQWHLMKVFLMREGNLADSFRLFRELRSLSLGDVVVADMVSLRLVSREKEADGVEVSKIDPQNLTAYLKKTDSPTVPEFADLEVFIENTTRYVGLGSHWGRFVETGGFHLVGVGDNAQYGQRSTIRFENEETLLGEAGQALRRLFPLFSIEVGEIVGKRSEVVIRLGEDAGKLLYDRQFISELW